ncbi:ABC transporter ATP-binding protein [Halococcus sp. AFM35]|uniref:ABC transporter ATP-binding protein n=1 Tax=Halococcus sp. AFM35 TaxID=3421653 RepID=UPI003EBC50E6
MASQQFSEQNQSSSDGSAIRLDGVTKTYGALRATDDVSIPIQDGEFLTILGPSGAGKTTLLHMIAGFEQPTEGEIYIHGQAISDEPPYERDIGLVFQSLALFPHMTVKDNIAFPLKMRRENLTDIDEQVHETLELVRLPTEYADKPVDDLSGGQQQRVALARAVVYEPTLLLLDEPLSSLDKKLREEMRAELTRIHDETELTVVHVTHNQTEALSMADRIAVINDGELEQLDPVHKIYTEPTTPFVAEFIGNTTMLHGTVSSVDDNRAVASIGSGSVRISNKSFAAGDQVTVGLRAEMVDIGDHVSATNSYEANVEQVSFEGDRTEYYVAVKSFDTTLRVTDQGSEADRVFSRGDDVTVGWEVESAFIYEH